MDIEKQAQNGNKRHSEQYPKALTTEVLTLPLNISSPTPHSGTVIQYLEPHPSGLKKLLVSDGFIKIFVIANDKVQKKIKKFQVKNLSILNAMIYRFKNNFILGDFEVVYGKVSQVIGCPFNKVQMKKAGMVNSSGSSEIPEEVMIENLGKMIVENIGNENEEDQ